MAELLLHGRPVPTVFDLLGRNENDMTFALAWGMAQNDGFLRDVVRSITGGELSTDDAVINLQRHDELGGFTDVEVSVPSQLHLILRRSVVGIYRATRSFASMPSDLTGRKHWTDAWSSLPNGAPRRSSHRVSETGNSPILASLSVGIDSWHSPSGGLDPVRTPSGGFCES